MPNPRARSRALLVLLATVALLVSTTPASAAPVPRATRDTATPSQAKRQPGLSPARPDALTRELAHGRLTPARYALERFASLFDLAGVRARFGDVRRSEPSLATMYARDLAIRQSALAGKDRRRARLLLARPTDNHNDGPGSPKYPGDEETPICDTNVCVHYVSSGQHTATTSYAQQVLNVMGTVWQQEVVDYDYRKPKSDIDSSNNGGNGKLDIYLANVGPDGLYGYCTSDDPNLKATSGYRYWDFSAYCVLDNDYDPSEFGYSDPTVPLKVTAAHEFFHSVQFAYDIGEDTWFMEGTAVWMEDQVYDAIDDNLQYLASSPLSNPLIPIDRTAGDLRVYGSWIWWRFLSEYFGGAAADPTIIRDVWNRADGSPVGPDMYSTQAAAAAIAKRSIGGTSWRFRWAFADFAAWNVIPKRYYDEGAKYPAQSTQKATTITGSNPKVSQSAKLDHLTSRYVSIKRGSGVRDTAKVKVAVNGPGSKTGSEATVVVIKDSGGTFFKAIALNSSGAGTASVPFDSTISRVVVIVTNASTRFSNCYTYHAVSYSCWGTGSPDDNLPFAFTATLVQLPSLVFVDLERERERHRIGER
jgi:hypothetical protein